MSPPRTTWTAGCVLLGLLLASQGCEQWARAPESLRLAVNPGIYSGLIAVAEVKGYFRDAGVIVRMQEFNSGSKCQQSLGTGDADLATGTDVAVTRALLRKQPLRIIAAIATYETTDVVARKDLGINRIEDLRGRKVGLCTRSASLYYLETYLLFHGMEAGAVRVVDLPPQKSPAALEQGTVDAICGWDIISWDAQKRLGDKAVAWPAQNHKETYWLLTMRAGPNAPSPKAVERFLAALLQAQSFCARNPGEAKAIIAARWRLDPQVVDHYWDKNRLRLSLDNSLLLSLDLVADWLREKGEAQGEEPDFREHIQAGPLVAVDAKSVTLGH